MSDEAIARRNASFDRRWAEQERSRRGERSSARTASTFGAAPSTSERDARVIAEAFGSRSPRLDANAFAERVPPTNAKDALTRAFGPSIVERASTPSANAINLSRLSRVSQPDGSIAYRVPLRLLAALAVNASVPAALATPKALADARDRLDGIRAALQSGSELPPIVVAARVVGDGVEPLKLEDGHKRLSVARALGRETIVARFVAR